MLGYLIVLFTVIPAVELYFLIVIGSYIGAGNTILIIILTGVIGAYLAKLQGFLILAKIQENLNRGLMPSEELLDGALVLAGGIVLLTPGFLTDIMGFLFLLPLSRAFIKIFLKKFFKDSIQKGEGITISSFGNEASSPNHDYDDIDIT